jgi:two-component system, probable response regulator PhcQ
MSENRVLVVGTSKKVLNSIARALKDESCSVFTALSGEQGLSMLNSYEIDLVISDQSMPDMMGLTFLKKVKVAYPNILTMMVTNYPDTDTVIEAVNTAGIYKLILKPWKPEELRETVRRALHLRNVAAEGSLLVEQVKAQEVILKELERKYPGITKIDGYENGIAILKL